ncbi:protein PXR1-like [Temnothorax curvispinosus]|uniref:Protein PXR1-like n=1 Tax=Temnothorax curvispinosus TaxID=300111 RepID=A0A6J1QTM4_9HYME|nr:protein PXR1-like [Temnothorax curvispinosus]
MNRKVAITVDREVIEAIMDERMKEYKKEMKDLKIELDIMKRKVLRLEQGQGKRKREESEERGGLRVEVEVKEVSVLGQRGEWLTILLRMGSEDKWKVLNARRREGSRMSVKMDEDKPLEERIKERKEREKRRERKERQCRKPKSTAEDKITKKMEENLLMISDEDEERPEERR